MYRPTPSGPSFYWGVLLCRVKLQPGRSDSNPCSSTALTGAGPDAAHGCRAGKPQRKGTGCTERAIWLLQQCFKQASTEYWQQQHWGETIAGKEKEKTLCYSGLYRRLGRPRLCFQLCCLPLHIHCQATEDTFFSLSGSLTCREPTSWVSKAPSLILQLPAPDCRQSRHRPCHDREQGHRWSWCTGTATSPLWPRRGKDRACGSVQKQGHMFPSRPQPLTCFFFSLEICCSTMVISRSTRSMF